MDETTRQQIEEHLEAIYRLIQPVEAARNGQTEVEGIIGRPNLRLIRGKPFFSAGLKQEDNQWLSIAAWGKTAESAATILRGQRARVRGEFRTNDFVDASGIKRSRQEFVASQISLVESAGSAAD